MTTLIGNIIALAITIICLFLLLISFKFAVITYVIIAYLVFLYVVVLHYISKGKIDSDLWMSFDRYEREAFLNFPIFVNFPVVSNFLSNVMNTMRIIGFIWAIAAIIKSEYFLSIISASYFFISSWIIAKTAPNLYMVDGAKSGNLIAQELVYGLEKVLKKKDHYDSTK